MRIPIFLWFAVMFAVPASAEMQPLQTNLPANLSPLPSQPPGVAWPTVAWPIGPLPKQIDTARLTDALTDIFVTIPKGKRHPDTRAILAVHGGKIVLESYARSFGPDSRFLSWSLAKSVTNALVGILVGDGKLGLDQRAPVPEWQADSRRAITIRHLLNMTSGVDNHDSARSNMLGFVSDMLFGPVFRTDVYSAAVGRSLEHTPGEQWAYSSASSNILASIVAREVGRDISEDIGKDEGKDKSDTLRFMQESLLTPLGMMQTQPEFDQAGHFIGGTFVWASARDWARLGYLFLRDGVWENRRILPPGWVDFSRTPVAAKNNRTHGAHLWVAAEGAPGQVSMDPSLNAFYMSGARGQVVLIVPDRDLIVVRLGESHDSNWTGILHTVEQIAFSFPKRSQ